MKDLKETVNLMLSDKWEDRLIAEYWQTKIRYEKLHKRLISNDAGIEYTLEADSMRRQQQRMGEYLYNLEVSAAIKGINLDV